MEYTLLITPATLIALWLLTRFTVFKDSIALKKDVDLLRTDLKEEISGVRRESSDAHGAIGENINNLRSEMGILRKELREDAKEMRQDIKELLKR